MYSKYIMDVGIVSSAQVNIDNVIQKCKDRPAYIQKIVPAGNEDDFKKYVESMPNKRFSGIVKTDELDKLVDDYISKRVDGGRRSSKQSKKRATRRRRRSSKRKARKARTTRRKY